MNVGKKRYLRGRQKRYSTVGANYKLSIRAPPKSYQDIAKVKFQCPFVLTQTTGYNYYTAYAGINKVSVGGTLPFWAMFNYSENYGNFTSSYDECMIYGVKIEAKGCTSATYTTNVYPHVYFANFPDLNPSAVTTTSAFYDSNAFSVITSAGAATAATHTKFYRFPIIESQNNFAFGKWTSFKNISNSSSGIGGCIGFCIHPTQQYAPPVNTFDVMTIRTTLFLKLRKQHK